MTEANGKVYFVTFQRPVLGLQKVPEKPQPGAMHRRQSGQMTPSQSSSFGAYQFSGAPEPVITLRYDWVPYSLISDLHPFECFDAMLMAMVSDGGFRGFDSDPPPVLISFQALTASDLVDLPQSIFRAKTAEDAARVVEGWRSKQ